MSDVFIKVVSMSLSASLIAVLVIILRLVLKKAPKSFTVVLWGIVALRLLFPFSLESSFSLMPVTVAKGDAVEEVTDKYLEKVSVIHDDSVYYDAAEFNGREPVFEGEKGYYVITAYDQLGEASTVRNTIVPVLSIIWISGVLILSMYTAFSYLRLSLNLTSSEHFKDNIYFHNHLSTPFVFGIAFPRIYLPGNIDEKNLSYVIAHEKAHILRKDYIWKLLGYLILVLYWFNPLLWLSYFLFCRDIELACDERVIRSLKESEYADYSQALLDFSSKNYFRACPIAFGEIGVRERIKAILNYKRPSVIIIILSVVICIAMAFCFLTNPFDEKSVEDRVLEENGYEIVKQEDCSITLSVPLSEVLIDDIFTIDGAEFKKGDIIAFKNDTTAISLTSAQISNEGDEYVYFIFDFEYDLPTESGSFLSHHYVKEKGIYSNNLKLKNKYLYDENTAYENAVSVRGEGPGNIIAFYVSTDVLRKAVGVVEFYVTLNNITYKKDGTVIVDEENDEVITDYLLDYTQRFPDIKEEAISYANIVASDYTYDYSVGTSLGTLIKLEKVHSVKMSAYKEIELYYTEYFYTPTLALPGETDNYVIYPFYLSLINDNGVLTPLDWCTQNDFQVEFNGVYDDFLMAMYDKK